MKLAEALILRADYQKRLLQIRQRLVRSATVQEGESPPENPQQLLVELEQVASDLVAIIQQINRTNSSTPFQGRTLADALAERDVLTIRTTAYREFATAGVVTQSRTTRSEVKFYSTFNVAEMQTQADQLARERRELDARIQEANWLTELLS